MNSYALIMIIPVVLAVALVIAVIRRNITERQPNQAVDIVPVIPAVIVLLLAAMLIGSMAGTTLPFSYDSEDGRLTISQNVDEGYQKYWAEYAADVESVVIADGVTSVPEGALASMTGIKQLSIPDSLESPGSLGVTLKDVFGEATAAPGEYAGFGDGELWLCDPSIFTYSSGGSQITGLSSSGATAVTLVLPKTNGSTEVTSMADGSSDAPLFSDTTFTKLLAVEGASYKISEYCFTGSSLTAIDLSSGLFTFGTRAFSNCRSLTSAVLSEQTDSLSFRMFDGSTSLVDFQIPAEIKIIGSYTLQNTAITEASFPSSVTAISQGAFQSCSSITSVSFAEGFSASINATAFNNWTFYAADGTTVITKTDASALSGHTFEGTASALVMVEEGNAHLTKSQLQQVQLHTQELQQQELDIQPFTPAVQTNDMEATA